MGGLKALIGSIWKEKETVIYRPPAVYNAATNIFNVQGAVIFTMCGLRATAAAGGATTLFTAWNGVLGEAAAVDIGTGTIVGEVVSIPLNVAAVIGGSFGAIPLTTVLLYPHGMLVGTGVPPLPGVVVFTFAVSTWTGEIFAIYRKLTPGATVTLA